MGINFATEPVRSIPKQLDHKRGSKTAKQRGAITPKVAAEVDKRSGNRCERCGWQPGNADPTEHKWTLQRAHLRWRWRQDETTAEELAKLCGPSTKTKTCHYWIDHTAEGMKWALRLRARLLKEKLQQQ